MKHVFATLLIMCCFAINATAQNSKFGKPTQEEWALTSVDFAPDADAVVLYKSVDVTYKLDGAFSALGSSGDGSLDDNHLAASGTNKYISPEGCSMEYTVKVRVKVLKDSGAQYTSMDIIYLDDKEDLNMNDDLFDLSVVVFSEAGGKVKKRRNASIKTERVDDHYSIRHIRIPDIKAGDIVEYQYKMFSNRITFIYDTQLQESIPVMYSRCMMDIPYIMQFNVNKPEIKNVTAKAERGTILIMSPTNDRQLPRKCASNVFTIEARNLPAYTDEITLQDLTSGKVHCVRTALNDKRYDVKVDKAGPVRHLIIGK